MSVSASLCPRCKNDWSGTFCPNCNYSKEIVDIVESKKAKPAKASAKKVVATSNATGANVKNPPRNASKPELAKGSFVAAKASVDRGAAPVIKVRHDIPATSYPKSITKPAPDPAKGIPAVVTRAPSTSADFPMPDVVVAQKLLSACKAKYKDITAENLCLTMREHTTTFITYSFHKDPPKRVIDVEANEALAKAKHPL